MKTQVKNQNKPLSKEEMKEVLKSLKDQELFVEKNRKARQILGIDEPVVKKG